MATPAQFGKKDEIYGFQTLFRELGYYISRLEQYERSLKFFDEAIKNTPLDKRALIGRSRARAKACLYEGSIDDINKALKINPDDLVVLAEKALNTYLSCEFEEGLLQNTRLLPIRQKPENFAMGVMHCSNAIENCVGERAGRPLRDHFRFIRRLAWKRNYEAQKPFEPKPRRKKKKKTKLAFIREPKEPIIQGKLKKGISKLEIAKEGEDKPLSIKDSLHSQKSEENRIPPFGQGFKFKPLQNYTTNIENYMAEKYLDSMYLDKIFLKKLRTQPGAICPNQKGSAIINQLAKTGYKIVSYKQDLLRTRRPFYFIKYQEATVSGALKARQEEELNTQQQNAKKEADVLLAKMQEALKTKNLRLMLDVVEKLKMYCDSKSKRLLMDKDFYLQEIYRCVCRGFYDLNRLNKEQFLWDQEKRIFVAFGLPVSRSPSSDSVVEQFRNVFIDYKKLIHTFEKRLQNAICNNETCWCYHELSRFHIELKRWDMATVYARKCIQDGYKAENMEWVINGTMLLAKINVSQHNKNDAKSEILSALEICQSLDDANLQEYLDKCLDVIDRLEFDETQAMKVLEKREKNIVAMMTSAKMKDEVSHLFRMMAVMPSSRRMLVMPGVRIEDMEKKSKINRRQSIMPGSKAESKVDSTTHFSFAQRNMVPRETQLKKDKESRGVGFMELIQYHV
ncbi:tetratricopeptide repeat protein 25-like [Anoplophora glabripennis]|uniref:tetratricopeptide repeat protein 25-like n=1 Tax=Anoplophora glabripennis TaxID=217634 RepID=UPI000873FC02|nr:tetratricopeptide repeat protein 25-like [Anoplophora glabripennis]